MKIHNAQDGHNAAGTPLSHRGYVVCQTCGKEVQGISRETAPQFAYCLSCRQSSQREVIMPAVPKPSQAKEKKSTRVYSHRVKAVRVKPEMKKAARVSGSGHVPPKKGKCGAWLEEITARGGATRQELIDGCVPHGLKATMHVAMAAYCRQLGLLKA